MKIMKWIVAGVLLPCCLLLVSLRAGPPVFGDRIQAKPGTTGGTLSFTLKYDERSSILTRLTLGQQEVRFRKEPDFTKGDIIVRQALKIGPGPEDYVAYAVNLSRRTLFLDLNRNLDLTDDPQGVYRSINVGVTRTPVSYFRGVKLELQNNGTTRPYLLDPFYYYGADSGYVGIRSCYRGNIELAGRKWELQIQDNLDGRFDGQDKFMLTPVGWRLDPKGIPYPPMPVPGRLYWDNREYKAQFAIDAGGRTATATFVESDPPMSELALDKRFARRILLAQGNELLVSLENPEPSVRVPAGDYRIFAAYLQVADGKPILTAAAGKSHFTAAAGTATRVRIGAPFVSTATAQRQASSLVVSYVLKGAAGEVYTISNPDRTNPPRIKIYRGDQEVASGAFQFG